MWLGAALAAQQPPRFQASVEVTSIDVGVVDDNGRPVRNLRPDDFVVRIDGRPRAVVSAQWVSIAGDAQAAPKVVVPPGYSSNENSTTGRLIVIGVDQPNIRFGAARGLMAAVNAFIDKLSSSDRIAAVGFGVGGQATSFTADRDLVKQAISRMVGQRQMAMMSGHNIALAEALDVSRSYPGALGALVERECRGAAGPQLDLCIAEVQAEAESLAHDAQEDADQTIRGLRELMRSLRSVDAPKTLVLISEGFVMQDVAEVTELGSLAAACRTSIYVLKLDEQLYEAVNAKMPMAPFEDRRIRTEGLETLASSARGAMFTVVGTGAALFQRIESEISGYYLLGIESDARDRDGKAHPVRVDVTRRGALVRSRRQLLNTVAEERVREPHQAVMAALTTPLLISALPLRVATFGLQGPDRSKVQVLIHAEIGTDYTASRPVTVGFVVFDREGRIVQSQANDARAEPLVRGVPSPLQYSAGASLVPGDYTMKLVAAEGDRVGSVQHGIHAALVDAGAITLSELMAGGPPDIMDLLRPTVSYTVSFGALHGYVEAYGPDADSLNVKYEIATDADAAALLSADVPARTAGDRRVLFTRVVPVPALPPGKYLLRAVVSKDVTPLRVLTREFEIAPPPVLMTSAENGTASANLATELFLPVDEGLLAPGFRREDALQPGTLQPFRALLPPAIKDSFEEGVGWLAAGDVSRAAESFKRGIQPELESTAQLVYLAVCYAAIGRDREAAGAWQTALIDGDDNPQIYVWLGDALLRNHSLGEARTLFQEAADRWPSDLRFTRPLALLYATFGQGREAVLTLERYLSARPDDAEALFLGVEWLYTIHASGALVHSRPEDFKLAHMYADGYQKSNGSKVPLVKQWIDFLDREKR